MMRAQTVADRARDAPDGPGVYLLFGADRELMYAGKAASLRRRLLGHSRDDPRARLHHVMSSVRDVAWIECRDEYEALCLEADVITALRPPWNATMATDASVFIHVDLRGASIARFRLVDAVGGTGRSYGAFPHLGKGKASWRAVRTNAGYSAVLRLMWVTFAPTPMRARIPARLRGTSPPIEHETNLPDDVVPSLHAFLSGRSERFVSVLREGAAGSDVPSYMRKALTADLHAARGLYRLGPQALRGLRLRHRLPPGPVDERTFVRIVTDDVRDAIGTFTVRPRTARALTASSRSR